MSADLPGLRPTRPVEWGLWFTKLALKRSGVGPWARSTVIRVARPTYPRTLRAIPNREELPQVLNSRGLTGTAVEVGVAYGNFSVHMLRHWQGVRLISVDPWETMPPEEYVDNCNTPQETMEESYETTRDRLAEFGTRSEIWRQTGGEAAKRLSPGTLDFVYIDAMHTYEAVRSDLEAWFPLVRAGGIIAGHDYNDGSFAQGLHGVRSAVDEFFGSRGIRVAHTHTDVPSVSWVVQVP